MNETYAELPITVKLTDLVSEFVADTDSAAEALRTGRPRGVVSGLKNFDKKLGGYFPPGLHILQSAPGVGKTAFALQMASDCCFPCLYVSTEMGLLELFRRLVARNTSTFLGKLKSGEICGTEANRLALATAQKSPSLALMDATKAHASPEIIYNVVESLKERFNSPEVLIIMDSFQPWTRSFGQADPSLEAASEYDLVNRGIREALALASNLKSPVLAIAHRNRAGNKADGGMHASKGSGDLEYFAESVIDLNRKKDNENASGEFEVTATFHKNRHNTPGEKVDLLFSGALQNYREV